MTSIRLLLTPPVFDEETKTHQAFVLHVILWALIAVPVPYVLFTAVRAPEDLDRALNQSAVGEAINFVLLYLLRRGKVRLASVIQVVAFWGFFTVVAVTGPGVRGPAYLVGYGVVIVVAGVLLGGRGALVMTVTTVLSGAAMVIAEARGLVGLRQETPLAAWIVSAVLFPVSAVVQHLAARTIQRALARARASEARYRVLLRDLEAKNAELERFTYTVSHDLKSPLITIRGFAGYLERDAREGDVERVRGDVARIADATDKMRRLLDELLELSRIGRLMNPPEDVPFGDVAREAVELVRGRLEARGVAVDIAADLPAVRGDRARLVEVVQNLVDNAAKYMGDTAAPRIEIGMRDGEASGVFFVRDNGIGIALEHQPRVFGLFDKLDPGSEGTGVGLALVKRIVEVHGGRIWVESAGPGRGATFCFTLPSPPPPPPAAKV